MDVDNDFGPDPFEEFAQAIGARRAHLEEQEAALVAAKPAKTVDDLAAMIERADALMALAKANKAGALALVDQMSAGADEAELVGVTKRIKVVRNQSEGWDQKELAEIIGGLNSVPHCVNIKYDITDATWRRMTPNEQAYFASARKTKGTKMFVEVEDK